ncbi:MAG: CapA family protein [Lachnospiraceae bacterium]|nr:CapA family protein [Lachnospiraceae bacterium]
MNNDEIKALLRELKESSDAGEHVKGRTVKINFGEEPKEKKKPKAKAEFESDAEDFLDDDTDLKSDRKKSGIGSFGAGISALKHRWKNRNAKEGQGSTLEAESEALKSEADAVKSEPEGRKSEHGAVKSEPEGRKSEHGAVKAEPEGRKSDHGAVKPESGDRKSDLDGIKSELNARISGSDGAESGLEGPKSGSGGEESGLEGPKSGSGGAEPGLEGPKSGSGGAESGLEDSKSRSDEAKSEPETQEAQTGETASGKKKISIIKIGKNGKFQKTSETSESKKGKSSGRNFWQNLKFDIQDFFDDLKRKGIAGKELAMIGVGVCLLILIILLICSSLFQENKSVNVTADDGLRVTVEQEPESWCSLGSVELRLYTGKAIQSVTVNGSPYQSEDGNLKDIILTADSEALQLMVVTEESVLNAMVDIPMIDTEYPMVSAKQENGQVTLNAADSRSGLAGIYYGTQSGFSDVPVYQKYTGPFQYEEGTLYYYYAQDNAGNKTIPVCTNMEAAQSLALSETEMVLFPGSSFKLSVSASPENAYYNNLQMTNQNPSIVSLDADGTVTALQEGTAVIEVQAEGLPAVNCQIEVKTETTVTISTVGDCTLGTDANFSSSNSFNTVQAMYGSSYFFQNVKSILSEDDITFANFEGTLTTLDTRADKEYAFKGDPSYTEILKEGSIEAVTLANNHSSDYGEQSLADTKKYLSEAGIDYCTGDEIVIKEVNGIKTGLIGIYVLADGMEREAQVKETIAAAKAQGAALIVVAFHWGTEKSDTPDETQKSLAHTAIDSGADLVVGHHPHVLQGIELYNGKYIVYSLGNFCFGGNSTPSDMDTIIFQQTFTIGEDGVGQDNQINIIPCSISSDTSWNNYQPTPATGDAAASIFTRINEMSAPFGQSFS